jgi:uncharacterized membrane protein YeaQ/YmgE (transglycosylase-associated protein family)
MENQAIGWIAAIIIGGIAGWLAEQFMKSEMGLVMNIVLGIVGAVVASWLFSLLGISLGGWIGYLITLSDTHPHLCAGNPTDGIALLYRSECPLPQERTCAVQLGTSAKCQ